MGFLKRIRKEIDRATDRVEREVARSQERVEKEGQRYVDTYREQYDEYINPTTSDFGRAYAGAWTFGLSEAIPAVIESARGREPDRSGAGGIRKGSSGTRPEGAPGGELVVRRDLRPRIHVARDTRNDALPILLGVGLLILLITQV